MKIPVFLRKHYGKILSGTLLSGAGYLYYVTHFHLDEKPIITYASTPQNDEIVKQCDAFHVSTGLLPIHNPHLQTYIYTFISAMRKITFAQSDLLTMEDGGTIGVDWLEPPNPKETAPTVIVMHGLSGCSRSMYTHIYRLKDAGFRIVAVNRRGHGTPRLPLTSPKFSVFGDSDDLRAVVDHVHAKIPESPLAILGLCAGAGAILAYVADEGEKASRKSEKQRKLDDAKNPVRVAIALSPAFHLPTIMATMPWIYSKYFAVRLRYGYLEQNRKVLENHPAFEHCNKSSTFAEFVERAVPFTGHKSLDSYLAQYDTDRYIRYCRVPTLWVSAFDDPVCVREMLDNTIPKVQLNQNIFLATLEKGAHAGFIQNLSTWASWLDDASVQFIAAVCRQKRTQQEPSPAKAAITVGKVQ